jgi:DNA-binding SARP family transcriptional activator
LFWADKPQSAARQSLREALRALRRSVEDVGLETDTTTVRLGADAVTLDTDELDRFLADEDWAAAVELIGGELLEGFSIAGASAFEDWLGTERLARRHQSVDVLARRMEQLLTAGDVGAATALAHRAIVLDPGSDKATQSAMVCLALSGDRTAALAQYDALKKQLEEIGLAPAQDTVDLRERVQRERRWQLPARAVEARGRGAESRRAPLVGRETELARLLETWENCKASGRSGVVIVEGDPGTGKTRLADEVLARARLDGAACSAIRAVPTDENEPLSGLVSLARGGLASAAGAAAADPAAIAVLAAHAPEWAERFRGVRPDTAAENVGKALRLVLQAIVDEEAVFLMVDDAQWLDRESLLGIQAALRDLANSRLFVFLNAATHHQRAEIDDLKSHIGRDTNGASVHLGPLSAHSVRALAAWAVDEYDDEQFDRLGRRILADSAGLPLLAVELLHAVALGFELAESAEAWPAPFRTLDHTLPVDLPDAVVGAIRVGFRRLSGNAQQVLIAGAVLGERASVRELEVGAGIGGRDLAAALDELEWERWLVADPRGYSFVAKIVREVVAQDMVTPGQRLRIANAVASRRGEGPA